MAEYLDGATYKKEQRASDGLKNLPLGKLVLTVLLPAVALWLCRALYLFADRLFLLKNAADFARGDFVTVEIFYCLALALAVGLSAALTSLIARSLGKREREKANAYARLWIVAAFAAYLIAFVAAFLFKSVASAALGREVAREAVTLSYVLLFGSAFVCAEIMLSAVLQGAGDNKSVTYAQLIGLGVSIALNALLVFAFNLGVAAVAISTVIGQLASLSFIVYIFISKKNEVSLARGEEKTSDKIKSLVINGLPLLCRGIGLGVAAIIAYCVGVSLSSADASFAFIDFQYKSLCLACPLGVAMGALPILSYGFGAGLRGRFIKTLGYTFLLTLLFSLAASVLTYLFADGAFRVAFGGHAANQAEMRSLLLCLAANLPLSVVAVVSVMLISSNNAPLACIPELAYAVILFAVMRLIGVVYAPMAQVGYAVLVSAAAACLVALIICLIAVKRIRFTPKLPNSGAFQGEKFHGSAFKGSKFGE